MLWFLATDGIPSLEQANKALTDQTWQQPINWWITYCFLGMTAFSGFLFWIHYTRANRAEKLVQDLMTADAEAERARLPVQIETLGILKRIEAMVTDMWKRSLKDD
jgi:hypothetical protein